MASQKPFERSGFDDAIPHHFKNSKKGADIMSTQILKLGQIKTSKDNPRKGFDEKWMIKKSTVSANSHDFWASDVDF